MVNNLDFNILKCENVSPEKKIHSYVKMVWSYFSAPPGPPFPKVTDWSKSSVDLEWAPPLKDGGSKVTGYIVEYKEEGTEAWVKVSKMVLCEL